MRFPLFQVTIQKAEVKPEIKVEPKPPVIPIGPYEKVIVFDGGSTDGKGVTWIAALPRRVLMEHLDIEARRLKQPIKFRRAIGLFFGAGIGIALGCIFGVTALLTRSLPFAPSVTIILFLLSGVVVGVVPGWFLGPYFFKCSPLWFVRKSGTLITPVSHKTFNLERFKGRMKWIKDSDGSLRLEIPPGVMAQSATFLFHAIRSKDLIDMWRSVNPRMRKITMTALIVIAACSLLMLFLVGWSSMGPGQGVEGTPTPTAQTGRISNAK